MIHLSAHCPMFGVQFNSIEVGIKDIAVLWSRLRSRCVCSCHNESSSEDNRSLEMHLLSLIRERERLRFSASSMRESCNAANCVSLRKTILSINPCGTTTVATSRLQFPAKFDSGAPE